MKEFPNESKNKWTRIFKKKWFFPALYIVIAAFLLSAVVWYQNMQTKLFEGIDDIKQTDQYQPNPYDEESESVVKQEETIKMPVQEEAQTEIVTNFYDYTAEDEEQEKGLTFYNNRYYQSTGVDIAANDGETFEVVASLSGTVEEIKEDPLLGNVIVLNHGDEITTYYASLEEVAVKSGEKVKQGDKIGMAGKNLFSEESGTHVHFEIRKADTELNPEDYFNESLTVLKELDLEKEAEKSEAPNNDKSDDPEDADLEDVDSQKDEKESEDAPKQDADTEATKDLSFSLPV